MRERESNGTDVNGIIWNVCRQRRGVLAIFFSDFAPCFVGWLAALLRDCTPRFLWVRQTPTQFYDVSRSSSISQYLPRRNFGGGIKLFLWRRENIECVSVFEFWAGRMDVKGLRWRSLIARHVILQRLVVCFITHHKILWRDDGEMVPALILFHCFYGSSSDDNDVQGSCLCYIYYIISGMWMFLRLSGLGWPRSYQPIILLVITL